MIHTYYVLGMSCKGCKNRLQEALEACSQVQKADVNLEEKTVSIEMITHLDIDKLQKIISSAGLHYMLSLDATVSSVRQENKQQPDAVSLYNEGTYYCPMYCEGDKVYHNLGSCPKCGMDLVEEVSESNEMNTYKDILTKFRIALVFTVPIFIISMSSMLSDNPLYEVMEIRQWGWVQFLLSLPVIFYACRKFFERAWRSFFTRNLNMFTLVGIGSGMAFIFSLVGLCFPDVFPVEYQIPGEGIHLYFEATTVILSLVLLGQLLEAKAHNSTNDALKELLQLTPSEAILVDIESDKIISIDDIKVGDKLRIKPGDRIPVDGKIKDGRATINESMITGEPIPVEKQIDDKVIAGTINEISSFVMIVEKVGAETVLSQIIQSVRDAIRSKAPIQKIVDKIARYFVPIVILMAIITFIVWAFFGPKPAMIYGFVNAVAVLIIACPCALGLATPMSVMVGMGRGAKSGILIKNAEALQTMDKVNMLLIDKTGTLTEGKPSVNYLFSIEEDKHDTLLQYVASLNQYSEHPLAQAIVDYANKKRMVLFDSSEFTSVLGMGVMGVIEEKKVALGNIKMMEKLQLTLPKYIINQAANRQQIGETVSFIVIDDTVVGFIAIVDAIKASSKQAIKDLQSVGIEVIMVSGDHRNTVKEVASRLNIDRFEAGCLPQDKLKKIKEYQEQGKIVAMVGDGINDSPALAQADVGIAMGTGTNIAIESAEVTLMKDDLSGILQAKILSQSVMKNIKQNLFFAFAYNIIGIPIAAGILFPFFGILLSPMIAAAAMSFSSVSVIANALRLKK